jgi:Family of unknown function (DUF5988)
MNQAHRNPLTDNHSEAADCVEAMLEGGPASMPAELRAHRVQPHEHKIKVSYYGGHEHFERVSGPEVIGVPVVFRWTGRTRLAE